MATNGNTSSGGGGSSSSSSNNGSAAAQRAGLAQALADLAKGEQAAARLEAELGQFEARLDALLAAFGSDDEGEEAEKTPAPARTSTRRTAGASATTTASTAQKTATAESQPAAPGATTPGAADTQQGAAALGQDKTTKE